MRLLKREHSRQGAEYLGKLADEEQYQAAAKHMHGEHVQSSVESCNHMLKIVRDSFQTGFDFTGCAYAVFVCI